MIDDTRQAGDAMQHAPALTVKNVDETLFIPIISCVAADSDCTTIRRDGDRIELAFMAIANRGAKYAKQPAGRKLPYAGCLVVGGRDEVAIVAVYGDTPNDCRVHASLYSQDG